MKTNREKDVAAATTLLLRSADYLKLTFRRDDTEEQLTRFFLDNVRDRDVLVRTQDEFSRVLVRLYMTPAFTPDYTFSDAACWFWGLIEKDSDYPPRDPAYEAHLTAELQRLDREGHTCHLEDPIGDHYGMIAPCAACKRENLRKDR